MVDQIYYLQVGRKNNYLKLYKDKLDRHKKDKISQDYVGSNTCLLNVLTVFGSIFVAYSNIV
jgi:hypothetical protein